ncbi:DNA-binding transcriptional regulator, LysR family [Catalinimonas alkaloidigena]|uniref:DNA-binding transcriptional regulator, LysR family n=1 Tax=Catalinimonas alkaloidigena TaxID=1075417 RepID=A0A1G9GRZ6_9BACT|nr:LysR family transcriptional regulator [Catalinimonas alkaloidigena]SDL03394.1 DNA-binding transcriptional regulator, LysR family [Catalinimonas alkaloidigena]
MHDFRLRVFYSVATHLNFTKAAGELFISQPAVTQHIKELEKQYELRLFERRGNRISLTPGGERLLEYAEEVLSLHRKLENDLQTQSQQRWRGALRIGASTTIAQYVLPAVMASFYDRHTDVNFSLLSANTTQIADALLKGRIDLGLVEGPVASRDLKQEWLLDDELVVVAASKSEWARQPRLTLAELPRLPWVMREEGSGTRSVVEQAFTDVGIAPEALQVVMSLGSTEAIKSFLAAGVGVSVLSRRCLRHELALGILQVLSIPQFQPHRSFSFLYLQGPTPTGLAGEFLRFTRRMLQQAD